jgi:hypothetical protein
MTTTKEKRRLTGNADQAMAAGSDEVRTRTFGVTLAQILALEPIQKNDELGAQLGFHEKAPRYAPAFVTKRVHIASFRCCFVLNGRSLRRPSTTAAIIPVRVELVTGRARPRF